MRSILITGASTGIGRAIAERSARAGATVYAGARAERDLDDLRSIGANVVPLALEVTDAASVAAARAALEAREGVRLDALVNNAGIVVAGPIELLDAADLRRQFDVNVAGPFDVTRTFLPHLRAARGRVVTIGSISGRFATPYAGAYAASKHAIEAFCDALRVEMHPFGVAVVLVEPGAVKTPLWQRTATAGATSLAHADPAILAVYADAIERLRSLSARLEASGIAPDAVAKTVERALRSRRPRSRYLVGTDARVQAVLRNLPDGLRDRFVRALFEA